METIFVHTIANDNKVIPEFLAGGGEMGQRIREFDWSATGLGPFTSWPQNLRTCVRIMLTSRQPIWIGWGKDLIKLYNDPYKAIAGGKHPRALGMPASTVWKDIWRDIEPMLKVVMEKDEGTYVESQLLIMERNGYAEETYYTFSYTPIPGDDGAAAGMICANTDDTDRIISERQLKTLTELGKSLTDVKTHSDVIDRTIQTLSKNLHDFPFVLFYSIAESQGNLSHKHLYTQESVIPQTIDINADTTFSQLFREALATRKQQVSDEVGSWMTNIPKGAWEIEPSKAILLPIIQAGSKEPYGLLIIGCNPYRLLDEKYSSFFNLITDQVATSFATVHAMEEERKRAEALAEIDRAKTTFFSNISHEFRTPLTLLMGPIEDTLNDPNVVNDIKERMDVAYRNVLRMQKLVNTLLEFSRIEAGRAEGRYSKVNIVSLTGDLTSTFRSAVEKAGIDLKFISSTINDDMYVDIDMWEKIVLNLLSNAFKYTKEGTITVDVKQVDDQLSLSISDTGIGIPESELDKIFNRFHRVENSEGRSQEGTGIGLALVKELVKLHTGQISVVSKVGAGSTFSVTIPMGKKHLPEEKISREANFTSGSKTTEAFIQEALKWADPGERSLAAGEVLDDVQPSTPAGKKRHTVVFADDNADMRDYIDKLLRQDYLVVKATNGEEAFEQIVQHSPDLVLSDVMMPKLDGFGLLARIRNHPQLKNIPVILLSARAGEEAKVEGLNAGADDYLVKPFSAKELTARVDANIKISKARLAAQQNLKNTILQSPVGMAILKGEDLVVELANDKAMEIWGKTRAEVINKSLTDAFPEFDGQGIVEILRDVYRTGKPFSANEMPLTLVRKGRPEKRFINFIYTPLHNDENVIQGVIGVGIDVSEQVSARKKIEQTEERATLAIESADLGSYTIDLATDEMLTSQRFKEIWGVENDMSRSDFTSCIHPDDLQIRARAHAESIKTGKLSYEVRVPWKDDSVHWVRVKGKVIYEEEKKPIFLLGVIQDITDQKIFAEELSRQVRERTYQLQRSNEDLQQFAHVASHDLKEPVRKIKMFGNRLADEYGTHLPEKAKEFVGKIQHSTDRMISMIEGVLSYSSINSAEQPIEDIALNELFDNILSDLEIVIQNKDAVIKRDNLPQVEGADVLIYQLFYNIINNSLKFTKASEPPVISIEFENLQIGGYNYAQVTIRDNGIGFSNEHAANIFNTFTRLNAKDKYEGTGLGLALCKKIVERHNGFISAEGEKNTGSTFTVCLPYKQLTKYI